MYLYVCIHIHTYTYVYIYICAYRYLYTLMFISFLFFSLSVGDVIQARPWYSNFKFMYVYMQHKGRIHFVNPWYTYVYITYLYMIMCKPETRAGVATEAHWWYVKTQFVSVHMSCTYVYPAFMCMVYVCTHTLTQHTHRHTHTPAPHTRKHTRKHTPQKQKNRLACHAAQASFDAVKWNSYIVIYDIHIFTLYICTLFMLQKKSGLRRY